MTFQMHENDPKIREHLSIIYGHTLTDEEYKAWVFSQDEIWMGCQEGWDNPYDYLEDGQEPTIDELKKGIRQLERTAYWHTLMLATTLQLLPHLEETLFDESSSIDQLLLTAEEKKEQQSWAEGTGFNGPTLDGDDDLPV